jgi:putative holliday junction resolvase
VLARRAELTLHGHAAYNPAMAIVEFAALKAMLPREGRLMALDVGAKTVGVASSDVLRSLATPLTTVKRTKLAADLAALAELAGRHDAKALVIGLPLNMDGSEGPRCQSVRQFAANIANHGPASLAVLPVVFQDERLSTAAVTRGMIDDYDMSRAKRAERIDAAAAAWILESALPRLR